MPQNSWGVICVINVAQEQETVFKEYSFSAELHVENY